MPVKKKTKAPGSGMTAKQMKRRKPISGDYMIPIEPLTDNQKVMFDAWAVSYTHLTLPTN